MPRYNPFERQGFSARASRRSKSRNRLVAPERLEPRALLTATPEVAITLEAVDASGDQLTSIPVGGAFQLEAFAQDVESNPVGVGAAYLNVGYNSSLATISPTASFTPGSYFTEFQAGSNTISSGGQITDAGFYSGTFPTAAQANAKLEIWSVPVTAAAAGSLTFTPSTSDPLYPALTDSQYDVIIYTSSSSAAAVAPSEVSFTPLTLSVTAASQTAPTVTTNPASQTIVAGNSVTFTAAASGSPAPTVQWQVSTGGGAFTNISGATSTSLTLTTSAAENGNQYQAVFTNAAGSATTSAAKLTVSTATTTEVAITLKAVDASGNVLTSATVGETFYLEAYAQNQSSVLSGLGAVFLNVGYNSSLASIASTATVSNLDPVTNQADFFNESAAGSNIIGSGQITDAGFFSNTVPTSSESTANLEVWSVPVTATATGSLTFTPSPSNLNYPTPSDFDVVSYTGSGTNLGATAVNPANIDYAPLTLTVTSAASTAPTVTANPVSQSIAAGSSVTFTAAASGSPTPTVQWQVSTAGGAFTNIAGATSTSLTFTTTTSENGNQYRAVFTNATGAATTSAATLTVGAAPVVITNPISQTILAGAAVTFTASASGSPTPTVQWQVSTGGGAFTNIAGATATSLTFTTTAAESGNQYRAVFTSGVGAATTSAATLTVESAPVVTTSPASQTIVAGNSVTFTAAASGNPTPTVQWQVSTSGGAFTNIAGATATSLTFTTTAAESGNQYQAVFTSAAGAATTSAATLTVANATTTQVAITLKAVDAKGNPLTSIPVGGTFYLEAFAQDVSSSLSGLGAVFLNVAYSSSVASIYSTSTISNIDPVTGNTDFFNETLENSNILSTAGKIIDAGFFSNSVPTSSEATANLEVWAVPVTATSAGSLTFSPSTSNPNYPTPSAFDLAAYTGSGSSLGAEAVNPANIDFVPLTLTVTSASPTAPTVTTNPASQTIVAGNSVTFTATASGSPTPTVQWQVSVNGGAFSNIAGATATSLTISTTAAQNGNQYRAIFTNAAGAVTTSAATLTVETAPVVTTNPISQTIVAGNSVTFTVAASGSPAPSVQWQVSANGGAFANIAGATSTSLTISATAAQSGNQYRAIFTNAAGAVTTSAATLTVETAPVVTTNPLSQTIIAGNSVTFTAAASGSPAPSAQWQVSVNGGAFANITSATSTSLTISTTATQSGNQYRAVFTNAAGAATTSAATLTVETAPIVTSNPISQTIVAGNSVTFTAAASGSPTPSLQWQVSVNGGAFSNITSATATSLTITNTAAQNGYQYRALFTNAAGTATTSAATLTVQTVPVVTSSPIGQTIVAGGSVTFTAAASGSPTPTVQWQSSVNGGAFANIAGATSTSLTFTTTAAENGNQYRAVFTNAAGAATTSVAKLSVETAPVVAGPTTATVPHAGVLAFSGSRAISVSNINGAGDTQSVVLSVTSGSLTLSASGVTVSGGAIGSSSVTIRGAIAQLNAALSTLTFSAPTSGASTTLTVLASDGTLNSNVLNTVITLTDVAPSVTGPATLIVPQGAAFAFGGSNSNIGNAIAVHDLDGGGSVESVTLNVTAGSLTLNTSGVTVSSGATNSAVTIGGSLTALNAALGTLVYTAPSSGSSATLTVTANDGIVASAALVVSIQIAPLTLHLDGPQLVVVPLGGTLALNDTSLVTLSNSTTSGGSTSSIQQTIAVSAVSGVLTVSLSGGATLLTGASGSSAFTLGGTAAQIDAALATLSYKAPTSGSSDTIKITAGFGSTSVTISVHVQLTSDGSSLQNSQDPLDVNNDGSISPLDVLDIIADLRNGSAGKTFPDVLGEGAVSPLDVLTVISYLQDLTAAQSTAGAAVVPAIATTAKPTTSDSATSLDVAVAKPGIAVSAVVSAAPAAATTSNAASSGPAPLSAAVVSAFDGSATATGSTLSSQTPETGTNGSASGAGGAATTVVAKKASNAATDAVDEALADSSFDFAVRVIVAVDYCVVSIGECSVNPIHSGDTKRRQRRKCFGANQHRVFHV